MKEVEKPDREALSALRHLKTQFDLPVQELRERLERLDLLDRLAAAIATKDYLQQLRYWWALREFFPELELPGRLELSGRVVGIEATQSIQFFRPPVNIVAPAGRTGPQPENNLPLVARKATVLRGYIVQVEGVSGTVEWRAVGSAAWSHPLPALNEPLNPTYGPIPNRGNSSSSLNFRLPAAACVGDLEVRLTFQGAGRSGFWGTNAVFTLSFQVVKPLCIRLVRMRYEPGGPPDSPPLTVPYFPAPSVADFWRTSTMLRRMFPLSDICLWAESETPYDGDFSGIDPGAEHEPGTSNGGTTGDWLHILNNLLTLENAPSSVLYLMLCPPYNVGWAVGRTALASADAPWFLQAQRTLAHEIGHLLYRPHAPCGNPPEPDSGYPNYGSYPRASIGEFGVDIETLDIYNPATVSDFMSYCLPAWISPYTYEGLLSWLKAYPSPTTCLLPHVPIHVPIERGERAVLQREYLALTIYVYRNGRVRLVKPAFHLPAELGPDWGRETEYFVELRGEDGFALSARRLWLQDTRVTPEDAVTSYLVQIPWQEAASELLILRGETILDRFQIEPKPPRVSKLSWKGGKVRGKVKGRRTLSWKSNLPDTRFAIRYSPDGGGKWLAVASWLECPSCTIDFDALPGGEAAELEVLASAGFRTTRVRVRLGAVPRKRRVAEIIWPTRSLVVQQGQTVRLLGQVASADGEALVDTMQWESGRDGPLGTGRELLLHTLSAGRHLITLTADDGLGGLTQATRRIDVRD